MKRLMKLLLLSALTVSAAACGGDNSTGVSSGEEAQRPNKLSLVVSDLAGLEELQRNFGDFQAELSRALDIEVELLPVPSLNAATAALEADRVDLVLAGPAEYVVMQARSGAVPIVGIMRPDYRTMIMTRAETGARTLQDLRGGSIVMGIPGGTSTHLAPSKMLMDAGLDPQQDLEVILLAQREPALEAFLDGEADAHPIQPGQYEDLLEERDLSESELPIIAEGPELPPDVLMASDELPADFVRELQSRVLGARDPLLQSILASDADYADRYDGASLVAVQDADYDYMRDAFQAIGAEDLTQFPGQ